MTATITPAPEYILPDGLAIGEHIHGVQRHHLKALRDRGLTNETIKVAGIYSETDKTKQASILDVKRCPFKSAAIVIPYIDNEGKNGYARLRPDFPRKDKDKKLIKYESPRGRRNQVYFPPGVAALLPDVGQAIIITEGEFKALASTQYGFACIGLVGVYGWKEKDRESLLPEMERIAWKGREVRIAYDSDISEKPDVQQAESRLAAHLVNRGAVVKVVRIPSGPPDKDGKPTKLGLDDYLVTQADPKKAMRDLLDKAEDPSPPEAGIVKGKASEIDSTIEGPLFVNSTAIDELPRLRFHQDTWLWWTGGAYRELRPAEVRAKLVTKLMQDYFGIASSHTNNVLDIAKAVAILPYSTEAPAWIGGGPGTWPADEVLVAKNGIFHLPSVVSGKTPFSIPLTPRLFVQTALDYECHLNATRPAAWLGFLDQLLAGDPESIATLQEWFGYCLADDTRQQKMLMIVGPKRSGKGTIARIQRMLIGPANVCGPTLASLSQNFGLWPLVGKSLGIISDARLGGRTDSQIVVERLLSISGEDALTIDRKMLEPITCKLPTRLMILSNELPRLGDSSGALAGRMIILRLTKSFYGHEDQDLTKKLLAELPGILLWAIEGWRRLRDRGRFIQPQAASEMVEELGDLTSPIGEFIRDCCDVGPSRNVSRSDLYEKYLEWCKAKGRNHPADNAGFGRDLRAAIPSLDISQPRVDGYRVRNYVGIGLA